MPPLTPSRKRLSLCEKQKIIEDSKKPGFDKNKTCEKYGIGKSTLNKIMLTQKDILGFIDKGTLSKNKSVHKPAHFVQKRLEETQTQSKIKDSFKIDQLILK